MLPSQGNTPLLLWTVDILCVGPHWSLCGSAKGHVAACCTGGVTLGVQTLTERQPPSGQKWTQEIGSAIQSTWGQSCGVCRITAEEWTRSPNVFRRRLHLFLLLDSGFMEIRLLGEIAHNKGRQMFTLPTTAPQTVRQSHYTQSLGTISVVTLRSECGQQLKVLRFSLPLHFLRCKTNWAIDKEGIVYIRLRNGIVRGLMNYQQCSWFSLLTSLFLLTRCTLQS